MRTYHVDGKSVTDIPSLCEAFAQAVGAVSGSWGATLFTFDDRFFGGYGLVGPCEIVWHDSDVARRKLDAAALARWCQQALDADDYGSDRDWLLKTKAAADANSRTLFDEIVEGITTVSTRAPDPNWTVDLILS